MPHKQTAAHYRQITSPDSLVTIRTDRPDKVSSIGAHHIQIIETLQIRPGQQSHIFLGSFTETQPPKGFSVELNPDPFPEDSVVTKVLSRGTAHRYSLTLHIANYGTTTVTATISQV